MDRPHYIMTGLAFAAISILLFAQFAVAISSTQVAVINQFTGVIGCSYQVFTDGTTYYGQSCDTGAIIYSGTDAKTVIQNVVDAAPNPSTVLFREGTYQMTGTVTLGDAITIDGLHGAVFNRQTAYVGTQRAIFNIDGSDIIVRNLKLTDTVQNGAAKLLTSFPSSNISNIVIENIEIRGSKSQGIVLSSTAPLTMSNILLDRVFINGTIGGAGIVLGLGVTNATIQNSLVRDSFHTGIDVWGCNGYINIHHTMIDKGVRPNGEGIAITSYPDSNIQTQCDKVVVTHNVFSGEIEFDNIYITGESEKVIVEDNIMLNAVGRNGVRVPFVVVDSVNKFAKEVFIRNNIIHNSTDSGIMIQQTSTNPFPAYDISGNYIKNVGSYGIDLLSGVTSANVHDNMIYNPGQNAVADNAGIRLRFTNATLVHGNQIIGDSNLDWSIREEDGYGKNIISNNWVNKPISVLDTTSMVHHNKGYVTEVNFQSATFSIASTGIRTVTTNHTLSYTPTPQDCTVSVQEVTNVDDWAYGWIKQDGISSTTVTYKINVTTASGTGGATAKLNIMCVRH